MAEDLFEAFYDKRDDQVPLLFPELSSWEKQARGILYHAYHAGVSLDVLQYLLRQNIPFNVEDVFNSEPMEEDHDIYSDSPNSRAEMWQTVLRQFKFGRPSSHYPDGVTNLMIAATTSPKPTQVASNRVTDRLLCLSHYLTYNIDINQADKSGHTALDYARQQGPPEAVRLLEKDNRPIYYKRDGVRYLLNLNRCFDFSKEVPLGQGLSGEVIKVKNWEGKLVALKKFKHTDNANYQGEVALNLRLNEYPDPGWVKCLDYFSVLDIGTDNYLVMEYVKGITFWYYPFRSKREIGSYLMQLFRLIGRLEEIGIHHNDFHANNLMIDPTGQLRILDFGRGCFEPVLGQENPYDCPKEKYMGNTPQKLIASLVNLNLAWPPEKLADLQDTVEQMTEQKNWADLSTAKMARLVKKYFMET